MCPYNFLPHEFEGPVQSEFLPLNHFNRSNITVFSQKWHCAHLSSCAFKNKCVCTHVLWNSQYQILAERCIIWQYLCSSDLSDDGKEESTLISDLCRLFLAVEHARMRRQKSSWNFLFCHLVSGIVVLSLLFAVRKDKGLLIFRNSITKENKWVQ